MIVLHESTARSDVQRWNARNRVGAPVIYWRHAKIGEPTRSRTESSAYMTIRPTRAVVRVSGCRDPIDLWLVEPLAADIEKHPPVRGRARLRRCTPTKMIDSDEHLVLVHPSIQPASLLVCSVTGYRCRLDSLQSDRRPEVPHGAYAVTRGESRYMVDAYCQDLLRISWTVSERDGRRIASIIVEPATLENTSGTFPTVRHRLNPRRELTNEKSRRDRIPGRSRPS